MLCEGLAAGPWAGTPADGPGVQAAAGKAGLYPVFPCLHTLMHAIPVFAYLIFFTVYSLLVFDEFYTSEICQWSKYAKKGGRFDTMTQWSGSITICYFFFRIWVDLFSFLLLLLCNQINT